MTRPKLPPIDRLIACPNCDTLHLAGKVEVGAQARCTRCRTVLIAPRASALRNVTVLTVTAVILMIAAVFLPFLGVSARGFEHDSSIFGAALAFHGFLAPLSLAVFAMIVVLPLTRFLALIYVLGPMSLGRPPLPHARRIYRLADQLRPWSMAEVFVIGTGVALVKVAGLASVTLGPAFWAFGAMILAVGLADGYMCRWTVWARLDAEGA